MLSIVVPSYNRRDCVLALLADVHRQVGVAFEVIVVDDSSADDSVEAIRREFPRVRVLVNEVNAGPAVARNRGIRAALGDTIIGFDSDVSIPDPRLLAKVRATFAEFPKASGLALRILKPDGITDDKERWWHPASIGRFAGQRFWTSYFSGTGYALRRDAALAAGLFPEILYMHYEEVELAYRLLDGGGLIVYCPDLQVLHHEAPTKGRSNVQLYYKPRNQILLALSCLPIRCGLSFLLPRLAFQCGKSLCHGHFGTFLAALKDAVAKSPAQWARRKPLTRSTVRLMAQIRAGCMPVTGQATGERVCGQVDRTQGAKISV
jgi:GT2 family glycosyltransferase